MTRTLPTFLVIGAMRAGTTTLHYDLSVHPQICLTSVKEPNFFALQHPSVDLPLTTSAVEQLRARSITDLASYSSLFRTAAGAEALGDVSPSYLYSKNAAEAIHGLVPQARLIAVLRNPVDRAYSAYLRRAGVDPDPNMFVATAEDEHERVRKGKLFPLYPLILGGLYSDHLQPYLERFSASQLLICIYERFWPNYASELPKVHRFIGVEPITPPTTQNLNRSGVPRLRLVDQILRRGESLKGRAKRHLPPAVVGALVKVKQKIEDTMMTEPAAIPASLRSHLIAEYFDNDISRLEDELSVDLAIWRDSDAN